jgi:hypothetical protein
LVVAACKGWLPREERILPDKGGWIGEAHGLSKLYFCSELFCLFACLFHYEIMKK